MRASGSGGLCSGPPWRQAGSEHRPEGPSERGSIDALQLRDVADALDRLVATPGFRALRGGPDVRSWEFRLRVERLRARCLQDLPDGPMPRDVVKELRSLEALCIESLSGFHPWIASARAALLGSVPTGR